MQTVPLARKLRLAAARLIASHSKSKCMETGCDCPPTKQYLWCEGRANAWFCGCHAKAWAKGRDDIDKTTDLEDGVANDSAR